MQGFITDLVCTRTDDECPQIILEIGVASLTTDPNCDLQPGETQVRTVIQGMNSQLLQNYSLEVSHHPNSPIVWFEKVNPPPTPLESGYHDSVVWTGRMIALKGRTREFTAQIIKKSDLFIGKIPITILLSHEWNGIPQNGCRHSVDLDLILR